MFDRVFSAALAFCVLAAGTLAVGSALFEQPKAEPQIVYLPKVEISGKRASQSLALLPPRGATQRAG